MTVIVAVVLLLMLALLIALTWGLMRIARGSNGKLDINIETAAIPPKIKFHVEYTPPDHPPAETPKALTSGGGPEVTGSGGGGRLT